jgi:hypothetical protein
MSSDLIFIDLGDAGIDYVREHLSGVNVFCTALLAAVEAAPGKVITLAPRGVTRERLNAFGEGGLLRAAPRMLELDDNGDLAPIDSLKFEQGAYLHSIMRTAPEAVCIVDDFNPSWSEVRIEEPRYAQAFGVSDAVYHLFNSNDAPELLVDALTVSDTIWHGVAAICEYGPEFEEDDRELSEEALIAAAVSALTITCSAYDGEGFVAWRRL